VTGGAGFIGSNFVHHLLAQTDHTVTTLDALTYAGSKENLADVLDNSRHEFVCGDVRNQEIVTELVGDADAVVHFAAQSHVDRSIESSEEFVTTNVQGTQTVLDAITAEGIDRYLHISTDEVYGEISSGSFTEDDAVQPRNPYAATKAGADLLVQSYHITHGLPAIIVRPSNNFGPRQHPEKLIPKFVTRAAAGEPLPLYGDGTNCREWLYVEDTCRAIELVLESGGIGEIYNIGNGHELSNLAVTERIIEAVGATDSLIKFVEDRPGHDQRYSVDATKLQSLGWEPHWSFEEGLEEVVNYYVS
jgi:dTDP-glucose 4,6-dehydratase